MDGIEHLPIVTEKGIRLMDDKVIWTCTYCHINPSVQSKRKCPRCGRPLTLWDLSKAPLERKPEWPIKGSGKKPGQESED